MIIPGLETLANPLAEPAQLIALAAKQADRLRSEIELSDRPRERSSAASLDARAGRGDHEWVCGHLHDTALQILEFIAGDGFGTGLTASKISHLAGGAAGDLRHWLDALDEPSDLQLIPILQLITAEAHLLDPGVQLVIGELGVVPAPDQVSALAGAVREAVTNARKHARASQVIVHVQGLPDGRTQITIADDGIGCDWLLAAGSRGLGVRNSVIGRMRRVGGRALLEEAPGGGTLVRLLTAVPTA